MNRFSITAGTVALGLTTAKSTESLLQRCIKKLHFNGTARPKAEPLVGDESQLIDETEPKPYRDHSPLYFLMAHYPHVVVATMFSRETR
jgi:hypothetical protein